MRYAAVYKPDELKISFASDGALTGVWDGVHGMQGMGAIPYTSPYFTSRGRGELLH